MFSEGEYFWAWVVYILGVVCVMAAIVWLTRRWRPLGLRFALWAIFATFFLLPWPTGGEGDYLSPAWIVSVIEAAFDGGDAMWRAGRPLLIALITVTVMACVASLAAWFWLRYRQKSPLEEDAVTE